MKQTTPITQQMLTAIGSNVTNSLAHSLTVAKSKVTKSSAPLTYICVWGCHALIALAMCVHSHPAAATSRPYVPPTLAQKVRDSDLIVVARVGRLKYVKRPNYPDPLEAWEFSDVPSEGFDPYLNLLELDVLRATPATNEVQRTNERPDLPIWVQLGRCFPFTGERLSYPPTGEIRIFFLSRKLLRSAKSLHLSNCDFPSVDYSELPDVKAAIRQSTHNTK